MVYYRFYCLNDRGHIYRCHEIHAADDTDAIERAREVKPDTAAELWSGARKVFTFEVVVS